MEVICNLCGLNQFFMHDVDGREDVMCPTCGSLERHRYLVGVIGMGIDRDDKILHFSPNGGFDLYFKNHPYYFRMDRDMTDLPFKDNSFNWIIAVHVLEHIVDDYKAMEECKRVLKPGGKAVLMVPMGKIPITIEGIDDGSEDDREEKYGNKGHVRIYGKDYPDRIKEVFGECKEYYRDFSHATVERYCMVPEIIYTGVKQ